MCVVQCIIGGETAEVDSATRLEKKNDPERAEFRNTNLLAALQRRNLRMPQKNPGRYYNYKRRQTCSR